VLFRSHLETAIESVEEKDTHIIECKNVIATPVKRKYKTETKMEITYKNYLEGSLDFKRYKLEELKSKVKELNLHITGNKTVLKDRIIRHYEMTKASIKLQSVVRGWIVRNSFRLRGEAFRKRELCVNETDYVTLEPISEIPDAYFVGFQEEENGHVVHYGFNITSLIQSIKMNKMNRSKILLQNPYNRKSVPHTIIKNIVNLYYLCFIVYPEFKEENEPFHSMQQARDIPPTLNMTMNTTNPHIVAIMNYHPPLYISRSMLDEDSMIRYLRICRMRTCTVQERTNELFMEIDRLGNYTSSVWFSSLRTNDYIRLYRTLYEIWSNHRNAIPRDVRYCICPFHGAFDGLPTTYSIVSSNLQIEELRVACLNVFENLVYSGIDEEYRKLGTFHALSALTLVSRGAQQALPYLYESLVAV
jgi:hypothetical protein